MSKTVEEFAVKVSATGVEKLDGVAKSAKNAGIEISRLGSILLGVSFGAFIKGALEAADRVQDLSDSTGLSTGYIKGFGDALIQAGGKAKNTERILTTFFASIEGANDGTLKTREAFGKLGISLDDLKNASEQTLLDKAVSGLKEMDAGSQRTAIAVAIFGKAMRNVSPEKFAAALDEARAKASANAGAIDTAAAANQAFETSFVNLQQAAINALSPILTAFGETGISIKQAEEGIKILGAILIGVYSAKTLGYVWDFLKAQKFLTKEFKAQAAIQAFITAIQGPKGLAMLALGATAAGVAYYGLNKIMDENAVKSEKAAAAAKEAAKATVDSTTGGANRPQQLDEKQKAIIESNKRAQISALNAYKNSRLQNNRDISEIEINRDDEIAKAWIDTWNQANLTREQKEKEFQAKRADIESKAASEIRKIQTEVDKNKQLSSIEEYKNSRISATDEIANVAINTDAEIAKKWIELWDNVNLTAEQRNTEFQSFRLEQESKAAADIRKIRADVEKTMGDQLYSISQTTKEKEDQLNLERESLGMNASQEEVARANLDIEKQRTAAIREASRVQNASQADIDAQIAKINEQFDRQKEIAKQNIEFQRSFEYGWSKAYKSYADDATNAAKQAEKIFAKTTQAMEDSIVEFAKTGKFEFKGFLASVLEDLLRSQVRQLIAQIFGLGGAGTGGGGSLILGGIKSIGNLLGFADGGIVPTNNPVIVGERGPEILMGAAGRSIVSNGNIGGQTYVTYNIQALDAPSFKQMIAKDPTFIHAVAEQGRKSVPQTRR